MCSWATYAGFAGVGDMLLLWHRLRQLRGQLDSGGPEKRKSVTTFSSLSPLLHRVPQGRTFIWGAHCNTRKPQGSFSLSFSPLIYPSPAATPIITAFPHPCSPPQAPALSPCSPKPVCGNRSGLSIPTPALPQIYQCHYASASVAGAPAQAHSLPKSCPCALL